jgi:hypothetical protein
MEAFYSFNERFAKIRSKRVQKAIKGITGKTFSETDELNEDSPNTSSASKKKEAGPSKPRGKRNTSAGPRQMGSHEDDKIGDPNSFADADADELVKEHRSASKKKSAVPSGRSRGRGRKRMNVGQETSRNQEDSEIKWSTLSPDEDSHKRHTDNYKSEGTTVRRVSCYHFLAFSFLWCLSHFFKLSTAMWTENFCHIQYTFLAMPATNIRFIMNQNERVNLTIFACCCCFCSQIGRGNK